MRYTYCVSTDCQKVDGKIFPMASDTDSENSSSDVTANAWVGFLRPPVNFLFQT